MDYDYGSSRSITNLDTGMVETFGHDQQRNMNQVQANEDEVSLLSETAKPASTDELKMMLKEAGTELTVQYLTGEISFENFYAKLQKEKTAKEKSSEDTEIASTSFLAHHPNIPNFDQLMANVDDDEGSNDEEEEQELEIMDQDSADEAGALEGSDEEWVPDEIEKKEFKKSKGKDKRVSKRELMGLQYRKKTRKKRRGQYEIPKVLAGQHGQALLLQAQGKTEEAMKLLFEIIEKAPNAAAPFKTLGSIHEEKGDMEQALKFYMVSANLRKSDINEWFDLIDMWIRLKNEKMTILCFIKALHYAHSREDKLKVLTKRCLYYENFNHPQKTILQCRGMILTYMDRSKPKEVLEFGRALTKDFLDIDEVNEAVTTILHYFKYVPNHIDSEDVHFLTELLISQKNYLKGLEIIFKHCGVDVEVKNSPIDSSQLEKLLYEGEQSKSKIFPITKVSVPSLMSIDLRCKTMQCLMMAEVIQSVESFKDLLTDLMESDVEDYGDVYFDIAETMVDKEYLQEAKILLGKLINSETYNKAAVWLLYGQCLKSQGEIEAAAKAYHQVINMVPGHYEARLVLSALEQQLGNNDQALAVLSKDYTKEDEASNDSLLLLHKCQLLHSQGNMEEFITAARQLLSFNFRGHFSSEFLKALMAPITAKYRTRVFKLVTNSKPPSEESDNLDNSLFEGQKSEQDKFKKGIWDIYLKLCNEMYRQNRLNEVVEISVLAASSPSFCTRYSDTQTLDAEFLCLKICIFSGKKDMVYKALKQCLAKEMSKNQAWNLYCYIVTMFKNMIDLRFAIRALMKNPNNIALGMLNGSARLISGTYVQALGEFLSVYRQDPENSMALFCCALCLSHISSQSFAEKKNILIPQVMCLMNAYKDLRGECQETYYNLGRTMQQLNMPFVAEHYYRKALQYPPIIQDETRMFDLCYEIAFNLSTIYRKSGNEDLARYYIRKYCVI